MAAESQKNTNSTPDNATDAHQASVLSALDAAQAVIQFDLDGNIQCANENFLMAVGYTLDEIVGQHHRIFCDPVYAQSPEYTAFWAELGRGDNNAAVFQRFTKGGNPIWINASYNPLRDDDGQVVGLTGWLA
ncbi:MAG: PAS domain-containing protein, partial [Pseudomonadota bacterium]